MNGAVSTRADHDPLRPSLPVVSFVVLNWRNQDATRRCVQSIEAQRHATPYEIVVVDNESTRHTRSQLGDGPWRLVCVRGNQGFAGGMNAGAKRCRGEFVALLNNDVRLAADWLECALAAATDSAVGIVGGRSLTDDAATVGSTLPRIDPTGFTQLLAVEVPRCSVAAVDGAHLLVRRTAWEELGGFDRDFFAYFEDVDLCARALARGWRVIYEPSMRAWHGRGLSSDRVRWRRAFWARRNRAIWLAKHFPASTWRRVVLTASLDYLAHGVRGNADGPAESARTTWTERTAALAAAIWVVTHARTLAHKRSATVRSGQHDPGYRERLASLYEPPPFSPAVLRGEDPGEASRRRRQLV